MGEAQRKKIRAQQPENSVRIGGRGESPEPTAAAPSPAPLAAVRPVDPQAPPANSIARERAVATKASQIVHLLRGNKRLLARAVWIASTWKLRKLLGMLACALNQHDMEIAPSWDLAKGAPDFAKPSRYERCKRPRCRALRGALTLLEVVNPENGKGWVESDDFMVLAKRDCMRCFGRGYARKMILPGRARGKMPCECICVQPKYVERIPESELKRGSKGAVKP